MMIYFVLLGKDTIVVRDKTFKGVLGQRTRLSTIDVDQINKLYKCSAGNYSLVSIGLSVDPKSG